MQYTELEPIQLVYLNFIYASAMLAVLSLEPIQLVYLNERKKLYGQVFKAEEFRRIVAVIEEAKDVFVDKEAIIYTFQDRDDREKVNKIVVKTNKKVKKFGTTNALVTLSKVKKVDFNKDIDAEIFKKVE